MSLGSQGGGLFSPTDLLPSGPPIDVPPVVPTEVTEIVSAPDHHIEGPHIDDCDEKDDELDDPILKAKDW